MTTSTPFARRDFLRLTGLGAATLLTGGGLAGLLSGCSPVQGATLPVSDRTGGAASTPGAEVDIALKATRGEVSILPGQATRVWTYQAEVSKGDPASVQNLPDSYLGPIIRVRKGQTVRVRFTNDLTEPSIVHWHGLHLPEDMDGHPRFAIAPGQTYTYEFRVADRAGTYWFHPHRHGRTAFQAYHGLAGLLLVSDDEETAASLPAGEYDVPLVIQDRTFDANNQLVYLPGGMMDQMMGFLGERILVNGQPDFTLPVATRSYRLRLLNGSNSRIYKLGWADGTPLTVIATDGGLLEKPVMRDYVVVSPGERIELWADFSGRPVGTELTLKSLSFSGAESGMMGGGMMGGGMMMGGGNALPNGAEFDVLRVRVERAATGSQPLPERLSTVQRYRAEEAINRDRPRVFGIAMTNMMAWTINGRTFEMEGVAAEEIVKLNSLEAWEFDNLTESMDVMAHPMHVHGVQFQVVERQVRPALAAGWETVRAGYVDEGWKDTVLLMPGERVKILLKFADYTGLYLYHCHNLEHEDQGLMRNYRVEA